MTTYLQETDLTSKLKLTVWRFQLTNQRWARARALILFMFRQATADLELRNLDSCRLHKNLFWFLVKNLKRKTHKVDKMTNFTFLLCSVGHNFWTELSQLSDHCLRQLKSWVAISCLNISWRIKTQRAPVCLNSWSRPPEPHQLNARICFYALENQKKWQIKKKQIWLERQQNSKVRSNFDRFNWETCLLI